MRRPLPALVVLGLLAGCGWLGATIVGVAMSGGGGGGDGGAAPAVDTGPAITAVFPAAGAAAGGETLTLTGLRFAPGATVRFGFLAAGQVTVYSDTLLSCVTPALPIGPATVTVTNPDGQAGSNAGFLVRGGMPTLTAATPATGAPAGGTALTLTGTNFAPGAIVRVGAGTASAVTVVSATSLTCLTPVGPVGPAVLAVTNVDLQAATLAGAFTYVGPTPTVTAASPSTGSTGGGTIVTLTGTSFAAGATVTVGGTAATFVTVVSATSLTCLTPAGSAGPVNVAVTNLDGQAGTGTGIYTYAAGPAITSLNPAVGPAAGANTVTITGTGFVSGATVTFGGSAATGVVVVSATSITCTAPSGPVGPASVSVTNPGPVPTIQPAIYTYQGGLPTVTAVSPGSGPVAGGTVVTVTGTNFATGATVRVGGTQATSVAVLSATAIRCTTPAGPNGPAAVTVTNLDGQQGTLAAAFTYTGGGLTLTGVAPSTGSTTGGLTVTLTGTGFALGATVDFGGTTSGAVAILGPTLATAITPAGTAGTVAVRLTNPDTAQAGLPSGFTYIAGTAPYIGSVQPAIGPPAGSTTVTISGGSFATGATVTFGGVAATSVSIVNAMTITCVTPAGYGVVDVRVTDTSGLSATAWSAYTYATDTTPPTFAGITSASPVSAYAAELRWAPATDNVTPATRLRYAVYQATSSGGQNFTNPPLFLTDPGATAFVAGGLTPGVTHYFVVRARDEAGLQSGNTQEASAGTSTGAGATVIAGSNLLAGRYVFGACGLADGRVLVTGGTQSNGGIVLNSAEVYDPDTGVWSAVSPMGASRYGHAIVVLPDGRVLVAGGNGPLATAEIYDSSIDSWSSTGALATARAGGIGVLLHDGRVLLAGGSGAAGSLNSAEIYTPALGTWSTVGPMVAARSNLGAGVLLGDGRVLLAGGYDTATSAQLASAELFDPATGQWSATGNSLTTARQNHVTAGLHDGRVLVALGVNAGGYLGSAEIYDPVTNQWTSAGTGLTARSQAAVLTATSGRVWVIGGVSGALPSLVSHATVDIFVPLTGAWTAGTSLTVARRDVGTAALADGTLLTIGGSTGASSNVHSAVVERHAPFASGSWRTLAGGLGAPRGNHTSTPLADRRLLVAGGSGASGTVGSCEILDPRTGTWGGTGALAEARRSHTATLLQDGRVLVVGGADGLTVRSTCELFDPATGQWTAATPLPSGEHRYDHVAGLLPTGRVVIAGGFSDVQSSPSRRGSALVHDPATGAWSALGSLATPRGAHTASLRPDGDFLVVGGFDGTSGGTNTTEWLGLTTGTWTSAGAFTTGRWRHASVALADGRVLMGTGYNSLSITLATAQIYSAGAGTWTSTGSLATDRYMAAMARFAGGQVLAFGGAEWTGAWVAAPSSECFTPWTGTWTAAGALASGRLLWGAGVLDDETVVAAGGLSPPSNTPLASVEMFDRGLGLAGVTRPLVDTVAGHSAGVSLLVPGASTQVTGRRFRGAGSRGAGGVYALAPGPPLIELSGPIGGSYGSGDTGVGRIWRLAATGWASGTVLQFVAPPAWSPGTPSGVGPGHYHLRVIASGIPSEARIVRFP